MYMNTDGQWQHLLWYKSLAGIPQVYTKQQNDYQHTHTLTNKQSKSLVYTQCIMKHK